MNLRTQIRSACFVSLLSLSLFTSGCSSREARERDAYDNYQAAVASGSLPYMRNSLLALVAVRDDVAEYWMELGKVQIQLGSPSDAYYAFVRAHELDRSNRQVLQALTQLALRGGSLDLAEQHAEQLSLLSPDDPAVKMTQAYVALRRGNTDEAERVADELLVSNPYDPGVKVLKARTLLRTGQGDEAVGMLEEQLRQQPSDLNSLNALIGILERWNEWRKVSAYGSRFVAEVPDDLGMAAVAIKAALLSNDTEAARAVSLKVLQPKLQPQAISTLLQPWLRYGPRGGFTAEASRLGVAASPEQKIAYATFLNQAGAPEAAAPLVAATATLPVTPQNDDANAVLATSLSLRGRNAEALDRFEQVLALDPDHAGALEGRARLLLRTGQPGRARVDAQRLVTVIPAAPRSHILLAEIHSALGDQQQASRVLWNAFHQISADRNIYEALRVFVSKTGGPDAVRRLDQEFADQRDAKLTREFI